MSTLAAGPRPSGTLSAEEFRAHFPMLERVTHLAGCGLAPRSTALDEALAEMLEAMASHGAPWHLFEERTAQARERFAALVGADPEQIAVVPNASVGAYQVASTADWTARPRLVTTPLEFPSLAHIWLAQRPRGAEVVFAEDPEEYAAAVDTTTRLVSVPMTAYQDALRMPVAEIAEIAHARGAEVFVDAYQAAGVEPVDVHRLDCDYLVAGTSKYLLGLPGLAFLYARRPEAADLDPALTGWFGRRDPFAFDPRLLDFSGTARRYETGTPPVPACYAAAAGLALIARTDPARVRAHVQELTARAAEALRAQGESVREIPAARRGAHIGLLDPEPARLAEELGRRGVAVSARGDVVRVAFHYYNHPDDIASLCKALREYRSR
ncbi:aminotransferase class V-fold PLP-dependent enzyme [Streptomyces albidoflavus]|uniref:aminotransferase class V-fold PLP-dependent enzyme n=1 Tax=Streptomyces TaxID=1883 RepID=UPI000CD5A941|nr:MULTISPECIES: aminotransferase class V-fold PLP-dependent enzyme [Streptomyces]MCX4443060.1 aminotransferase class V-fold PLP-dependent enzyme [Streptomyces albidoflavus]WSD39625.1 aminotransferase class V-fold PLP-dependent enzyme [Streptomyces albidoflavus]WST10615.1 aminotransferase class V-fold PLP-dependent enzyme [Streptomyces albidoflavus]WTC38053.1 aminotransferase class V-fold PLP-dependent enzyme [Streptomyces albidoflavus]